MKAAAQPSLPRSNPLHVRDRDDALVALLIAAMQANGNVSAAEAARAHDIVWATRRFRSRSGESVGRRIDRMRRLIDQRGAVPVIDAAARTLPKSLRPAAFANAAHVVLVDGRMERSEARFLADLARDLGLGPKAARTIRDVIRLKNSA
jgi:tellurite resistance protein